MSRLELINYPETVQRHYQHIWNAKGRERQWRLGPFEELPPCFRVLEFQHSSRGCWIYATQCMSQVAESACPIEVHLYSPQKNADLVELLTVVAHYHFKGSNLGLGHTVSLGRPWLPGSRCDHAFLSLPYLDGPALEWMQFAGRRVRFLWLLPITSIEKSIIATRGLEALEKLFEASGFNYLDPLRDSVEPPSD